MYTGRAKIAPGRGALPCPLWVPRSPCLAVRKCSYIHKCMVPIAGHLGPIGAQWLQGQGHHRGRALLFIQK